MSSSTRCDHFASRTALTLTLTMTLLIPCIVVVVVCACCVCALAVCVSNDLWARVAASGLVSVTLDSFGKPVTVAPAPDTGLTWTATSSLPFAGVTAQFNLGSFPSTVNSAIYAPTTVQVTLFTTPVAGLQGQYCQASKWTGGVTGVCAGAPTPTPTPTVAPASEWFAVFYNNSLKSWLNQTFESRSPISARDMR